MRILVLCDGTITRAIGNRFEWLVSLGAYVADNMIDAIAYSRACALRK